MVISNISENISLLIASSVWRKAVCCFILLSSVTWEVRAEALVCAPPPDIRVQFTAIGGNACQDDGSNLICKGPQGWRLILEDAGMASWFKLERAAQHYSLQGEVTGRPPYGSRPRGTAPRANMLSQCRRIRAGALPFAEWIWRGGRVQGLVLTIVFQPVESAGCNSDTEPDIYQTRDKKHFPSRLYVIGLPDEGAPCLLSSLDTDALLKGEESCFASARLLARDLAIDGNKCKGP